MYVPRPKRKPTDEASLSSQTQDMTDIPPTPPHSLSIFFILDCFILWPLSCIYYTINLPRTQTVPAFGAVCKMSTGAQRNKSEFVCAVDLVCLATLRLLSFVHVLIRCSHLVFLTQRFTLFWDFY